MSDLPAICRPSCARQLALERKLRRRLVVFNVVLMAVIAAVTFWPLRRSQGFIPPLSKANPPLPLQSAMFSAAPVPKPRVVIVMDDLGDHWETVEALRFIDDEHVITLAVLPGTAYAQRLAALAEREHREVIVHVPMEPLDEHEMNLSGYLRTDMDDAEIRAKLGRILDQFPNAVGINNHMGSRFTQDELAMQSALSVLKSRHRLFLDSRTHQASLGYRLARAMHVPSAARDVFLDDDTHAQAIAKQFDELRRIARQQGHAIAIGHPNRATLHQLREELPRLRRDGFDIVTLTQLQNGSAN